MLPEWWRKGPCVTPPPGHRRSAGRRRGRRHVTRVAAIDCGTNSIRLLVADADPAHRRAERPRPADEIVRLGPGRRPHRPARARGAGAHLRRLPRVRRGDRGARAPSGVRFVATSASRDAENREDFVRGVVDILGVEPEVITGDQEAEFSFTGATKELTGARRTCRRPYLVVDIGGGSTEFVVGDDRGARRPLGRRRLRADDRAAPRARTARSSTRRRAGADRRHDGRHRAPRWTGPRRRSRCGEAAHPGRPRRLGHHGRRRSRWAWTSTTPAADPPLPDPARRRSARSPSGCCRSTHAERAAIPVDAPGPGRRDRRGRAGAAVDHGADRAPRRSWSASTTSSTASPGASPAEARRTAAEAGNGLCR